MPLEDPLRGRRYSQAGLVYGLLDFAVIVLTLATPELARPERRADLVPQERLQVVELLRRINYGEHGVSAGLQRFLTVAERERSGLPPFEIALPLSDSRFSDFFLGQLPPAASHLAEILVGMTFQCGKGSVPL